MSADSSVADCLGEGLEMLLKLRVSKRRTVVAKIRLGHDSISRTHRVEGLFGFKRFVRVQMGL